MLKITDSLDENQLKSMPRNELIGVLKEQVTSQLTKHGYEAAKVTKVIEAFTDMKQENGDYQYDLKKLLSDEAYLN